MSIGAFDAVTAYGRVLGTARAPAMAEAAGSAESAGGFGTMVEQLVSEAATSLRSAEAASARQVAGKGDLIDVVTAVGAAETALDTVVAVRDRMVNAYSEIMRMQI
ncbi:MAG: flagellar hook-basal body complex protein FliE [Sphingomonadaceae bacterium]